MPGEHPIPNWHRCVAMRPDGHRGSGQQPPLTHSDPPEHEPEQVERAMTPVEETYVDREMGEIYI